MVKNCSKNCVVYHLKHTGALLLHGISRLVLIILILYNVPFRDSNGVISNCLCHSLQIYLIALILAIIVFKIFNIPAYTAKDNLYGIVLLLALFGFAGIQMVHLCEKLFNDASLANMYILCMNILIAMSTVTTIILIDILGESDVSFEIISNLFAIKNNYQNYSHFIVECTDA